MQNDGRLVASGKMEAPRYTALADAFTKIKAQEGMVTAAHPNPHPNPNHPNPNPNPNPN